MQPIERYGVISLLFLIVTIVAVLLWDGDVSQPADVVAAQETGARNAPVEPRRGGTETPTRAGLSAPAAVAPSDDATDEDRLRSSRRRRPGAGARASVVEPEDAATLRTAPQGAGLTASLTRERQEEQARALEAKREEARRRDEEAARLARQATPEPEPLSEPLPESRTIPTPRSERPDTTPANRPTNPGVGGSIAYTVQPGDVLSKIAENKLGTYRRMSEIVALNPGLDPDRLIVGREIRLPAGGAKSVTTPPRDAAAKVPTAPTSNDPKTFRVRSGDSLWKIAADKLGNGERWNEIARLNPTVDPNKLSVGQALVLPTGATVDFAEARSRPVVASRDESPAGGTGRKSKGQTGGKVR